MLDVTRLRVIDAVARHGSVTSAARELHYSQPSVTHHLARLEAETGAQLLADRAAEIIGHIDAADRPARHRRPASGPRRGRHVGDVGAVTSSVPRTSSTG
jgi:DNA-binding transcriptional ArsR family regulator